MEYPRPIMSIKELAELGFSSTELHYACHIPGQTFATKTHGGGKWLIDTVEFDRFMRKRARRR